MPEGWGRGLVAAVVLLLLAVVAGYARELRLRPEDHGLAANISSSGQESSPEMLTFFATLPSATSAPPHPPPPAALPEAMNSDDAALIWSQQQQRQEEQELLSPPPSGWAVKEGLLIGSLVCGITGAALLVASTFIFLFFAPRKPSSLQPPPPSLTSHAHLHPHHRHHDSATP